MTGYITALPAAGSLTGDELFEISQRSSTVTITAATISAAAADNSFNDSTSGFVAAGFNVGDRVNVSGFTGDLANNLLVATITALTAAKMTIGGADGDVIVDDPDGESVTISKWESRRATLGTVGPAAATASEIWTGSATDKFVSPDKMFEAAAPTVLTSIAGATALDMATGINFNLTLDETSEIANPSNAKAGQSGRIRVTDDGTGGWTLTFDTDWIFIDTVPSITTAIDEEHLFAYFVNGAGDIEVSYLGALA